MGNLSHQSIAAKYFQKFGFRDQLIIEKPKNDLGIIVVIPSFKEPALKKSLQSLSDCTPPNCSVEVIVVLNNSERASEEIKEFHQKTFEQLNSEEFNLKIYWILELDLQHKHAGVGFARKIGMDEAARRFAQLDRNGVIACFDADSLVDSNYFTEIEKNVLNSDYEGASLYFEHPIEGDELTPENYTGIINYELFLRYYNLATKNIGLPFAFHTVGSSMLVKAIPYMLEGGMNRRKAGEDFYFLQKIIQRGNFRELNSVRVIPSARTSDRVPFGTGKAIQDWLNLEEQKYLTYDFEVFRLVAKLIDNLPLWFENEFEIESIPKELQDFFVQNEIEEKILEIKKNTRNFESFRKRFFIWFDAFKLLKLVHWYRDEAKTNQPILKMVNELNKEFLGKSEFKSEKEALLALREIERII